MRLEEGENVHDVLLRKQESKFMSPNPPPERRSNVLEEDTA